MITPAHPIVGVNVDGVLADYRTVHNQIIADGKTPYLEIKDDPNFWLTINPYKGTSACLKRLRGHIQPTYFITSRYGISPQEQTALWLQDNGHDCPSVIVTSRPRNDTERKRAMGDKDKAFIARAMGIDAMIDDSPTVFKSFALSHPSCCFFLVDQPWNQDVKVRKSMHMRVRDIGEALDKLGV